MLELLAAWREIAHVSEWTGLSIGALAALAAIAWFGWRFEIVRDFVVVAVIAVFAAYGGMLHGNATGRADVLAEWDKAKRDAEIARKQHDADVEAAIRAAYLPDIANLQRQLDDNQRQAELNVHALMGQTGARCQLGDEPLRLRNSAGRK